MIGRSVPTESELIHVRWEERPWVAMLHLLGWIPIWGFLAATMYWLYYRQRSRQAVFHVQQVIQFQILLLLPILVWCVATILARVLGGILPQTGDTISQALNVAGTLVIVAAGALGAWAGGSVYLGRKWLYPLFGRRVLRASIRKMSEV